MVENNKTNRRKVLKQIGIGSFVGAGFSQGVAANGTIDSSDVSANYKNITGNEKSDQLRSAVIESKEYNLMWSFLRENYSVGENINSSTIIEVSESTSQDQDTDVLGYVIELSVDGLENGGITATIEDNMVRNVASSTHKITNDGEVVMDLYRVEENNIVEDHTEYNLDEGILDHDEVTTQWLPSQCDVCQTLYQAARSVGCGVTATALCAAAGLSTGGAALTICTPMVPAVCAVYNDLQDHGGATPYAVCSGELAADLSDDVEPLGFC